MISSNLKGRILSVLYPEPDPTLKELELRVVLDRGDAIDGEHICMAEGVPAHRLWLVHLPAEISEGPPRRVDLEVRSGPRLIEAAGFWI
jgi:hypothetical protein